MPDQHLRSRSSGLRDRLHIAPEVADALAAGTPVVALESTLISHGLPFPRNLEVAAAAEAAVRETGGVAATVAIHDGRILVGLAEPELVALATTDGVLKAARPSLAAALARHGWAATTVSATMIAADAAGIEVFATGGIGGVHRGALGVASSAGSGAPAAGAPAASAPNVNPAGVSPATTSPGATRPTATSRPTLDISSDLEELARTPVAVVCAGPKAILDLALTLEYLETRGVPVVTIGQDEVPGFYSRSSGIRSPLVAPDLDEAASIVATQLDAGLGAGVLLCVPVPAREALGRDEAMSAVDRAIAEADAALVGGPALTPWLLARVAELTEGASIRANVALIVNNARVAGEIAARLASGIRMVAPST